MLRGFIKVAGAERGLSEMDVGRHSFRSVAAMAMYMNSIPVFPFMLLGFAFLLYIHKTVVGEFSSDVVRKMIRIRVYTTSSYQTARTPDHTTRCRVPRIQVWGYRHSHQSQRVLACSRSGDRNSWASAPAKGSTYQY
jgi:hypothetical protein